MKFSTNKITESIFHMKHQVTFDTSNFLDKMLMKFILTNIPTSAVMNSIIGTTLEVKL